MHPDPPEVPDARLADRLEAQRLAQEEWAERHRRPPRGFNGPEEPLDGGEGVREPRRQPPLSPAGSAALEMVP